MSTCDECICNNRDRNSISDMIYYSAMPEKWKVKDLLPKQRSKGAEVAFAERRKAPSTVRAVTGLIHK